MITFLVIKDKETCNLLFSACSLQHIPNAGKINAV